MDIYSVVSVEVYNFNFLIDYFCTCTSIQHCFMPWWQYSDI